MNPQLSKTCALENGSHERYLHSEILSPFACAKFSRCQQVLFVPTTSGTTLWKIIHVDPRIRFETEGSPIPANASVVIKHVQTDHMLASSKTASYSNDFGVEFEVHCKSYLTPNKTQNLIAESFGRTTSDVDMKQQRRRISGC
ncbi:ef hand family protein [Cystoisospora suis]|uniref:Ef hand family protein n=1 Tax=Cystoisospora suis TaxID=483139 RepID=A0A2C6L9J8_9APIC|nr:ef hand family protein [Cystoisospora suis]